MEKSKSEWWEELYKKHRGPGEFQYSIMGKWIGVDMGSDEGDQTVVSERGGYPNDAELVLVDMKSIIDNLTMLKSDKRSERDRYLAVTITEMEKVIAYFSEFVVRGIKLG